MKILVTGGAGFIGANLVHQLLALEGEVLIVDDLSTGKGENIDPRAEFRKLDVSQDVGEFVQLARQWQPEVIVHLAAQASVAKSVIEPERTQQVNVGGTAAVARAAIEAGAARVVFASTSAVYGNPNPTLLPLTETAPTAAVNPYGASKLAAEELLVRELRAAGIDFALARFANVYGPRQDAEGEGGVVSRFCAALVTGEIPTIFGDGSQTRDFVYVMDVVAALISFIGGDITFAQKEDEPAAGIYHIATGQATSIHQLALMLMRISEKYEDFTRAPAREGDIYASVLSPAKAERCFEWSAQVEMEQGIKNTYRWFERNYGSAS